MKRPIVDKIKQAARPVAQAFQPGAQASPGVPSRQDVILWLCAGACCAALSVYALIFETWGSNSLPFVLLLASLGLASCWITASGPLYAERVRLTPLIALASILVLPPVLATLPAMAAGVLLLALQNEKSTRKKTLTLFGLILFCQLVTAIGLRVGHILPFDPISAPLGSYVVAATDASLMFGALYVAGLWICHAAPWIASRGREALKLDRGWKIFWANEAVVFLAGAPVAALYCLFLMWDSSLQAIFTATAGLGVLTYVNQMLGERAILRHQVEALEALTGRAMIDETASVENLLEEFLACCRKLILFHCARIWIYNDEEMLLEKISELSVDSSPTVAPDTPIGQRAVRRLGEELVGRVAERGTPLIVRDARRDARHPSYHLTEDEKTRLGPISLLELPLVACGDVIGVVEFERNAWAAYTPSDRGRIQSLATLVAMSVANIEQHRSICRQAITDSLTGLFNKRHILQILADEVRRAERYRHPLSVMMMDLDSFKDYNDSFGHLQGDILLQQLGQLIQGNIRSADSAGRYGGEEFILIMPETDHPAALVIAERIRAQVDAARFPGGSFSPTAPNALAHFMEIAGHAGDGDAGYAHKTISIGVATYPHNTDDIQTLLALADDALYRAKGSGRNQVVPAKRQAPAPDPVSALPAA